MTMEFQTGMDGENMILRFMNGYSHPNRRRAIELNAAILAIRDEDSLPIIRYNLNPVAPDQIRNRMTLIQREFLQGSESEGEEIFYGGMGTGLDMPDYTVWVDESAGFGSMEARHMEDEAMQACPEIANYVKKRYGLDQQFLLACCGVQLTDGKYRANFGEDVELPNIKINRRKFELHNESIYLLGTHFVNGRHTTEKGREMAIFHTQADGNDWGRQTAGAIRGEMQDYFCRVLVNSALSFLVRLSNGLYVSLLAFHDERLVGTRMVRTIRSRTDGALKHPIPYGPHGPEMQFNAMTMFCAHHCNGTPVKVLSYGSNPRAHEMVYVPMQHLKSVSACRDWDWRDVVRWVPVQHEVSPRSKYLGSNVWVVPYGCKVQENCGRTVAAIAHP